MIKENRAYKLFMEYLLKGDNYDRADNKLLLHRGLLKRCEGIKDTANYNGEKFLKEFKEATGIDFEWTKHNVGYCRRVNKIEWPKDVQKVIDEDIECLDLKKKISFRDGTKHSKAKAKQERDQLKEECILRLVDVKCDEEREVIEYMINLDATPFNKAVENNLKEAVLKLNERRAEIKAAKYKKIRNKLTNSFNITAKILLNLQAQSQPFYQPSTGGKTVRIYGYGSGMTNLTRSIRNIITKDWTSADLRSSQLMICSTDWGATKTAKYLDSGKSIWESLFESLELDYGLKQSDEDVFEGLKLPIKEALYSLCFGMDADNINRRLSLNLGKGMGAKFLANPYMKDMLEARERRIAKIREDRGARTVYGEWIELVEVAGEDNVKSILAQVAQAKELYLMYPIIQLAKGNEKRFQVVLWLHDGVEIRFMDQERKQQWKDKISAAVKVRADELNIPTYLEWGE